MPTITDAEVGQEVATDGILGSLKMTKAPTSYDDDYFCLMDGETTIYNIHVSTTPISEGSNLIGNGTIAFKSLIVKSMPAGATFDYELGSAPVLSSLNPATAVAGTDPDFVLSCIGSGFLPGTVIHFGAGADQDEPTTFVSDTEVTTTVKPALFVPDTVPVSVRYGPLKSETVDFTFTEPATEEQTHHA